MCPGGGKRPKTALPVMDLPAPDSPTIPTISPGAIVRLMSSNAVNTPCRVGISTRRPRTSRTGFIVSVQAQVLNLMRELQQEIGITYLFISHNLAVVHHMSRRVGVMYLGLLVETGDRESLFTDPLHPYTKMLMEAIPSIEEGAKRAPIPKGEVPSPMNPPAGCPFHPRCPYATARCREEVPAVVTVTGKNGPRTVACHLTAG